VSRDGANKDRRQSGSPSGVLRGPDEQHSCWIGTAPFLDGLIIHEARTGRLFQLNDTAARVWRGLRAGMLEELIVDDLARMHEADLAAVRQDVDAFVHALHKARLFGARAPVDGQDATEAHPPRGTPALDAVYTVGEVAVRVVCYPGGVAAAFAPLAAPARACDAAVVETRLALFRDGGALVLTRNGRVVERLDTAPAARWALIRQLVSTTKRGAYLALLHAGAIVTSAGCLLICGESGAGKSTLLAGLIHAGFAFLADDIVPLEKRTGLVWPVPLAISIKQNSWPLLDPLFPELAGAPIVRFGGRTMRFLWPGPHALALSTIGHRVAAVLFPRYAADVPATLSRLDPVRSLTLLGEGGSVLPSTSGGLAEFLAWWSVLPAYQLSYGRLHDAIEEVSTLTDRLREGSEGAANVARAPRAFVREA
jgi:hypothetical protein